MTRTSRMIVILAVFSLVAVTALAILAWRYNAMAPDLPVVHEENPTDVSGPVPEATDERFETFLAARAAVLETLRQNPEAFDSLCDEFTQNTRDRNQVRMFPDVLVQIRVNRVKVLNPAGMAEEDYARIREQYRHWVSGSPDLVDGWRAQFDDNEDRLDEADLGRCEALDY